MLDKLKRVLLGGANHNDENDELLDNMTKEQLIELVKKQKDDAKKQEEELRKYKIALLEKRKKREANKKTIDDYTIINIEKWIDIFKAEDAKHKNPEIIDYDENLSTFDLVKSGKNSYFKFRPYQQKFIEDWSIATNELVILYYGVGSGKTLIAINCGEQFINLNPESYIYFLLPASLVINTIMKMYEVGLDPRRKNEKGEYVYKFISYQQMMLSKIDIQPNSLLIIDEAHNLRNFGTKEIKEKESARKWKSTGDYSLMGNKVANLLLDNKNTFLRTIMMTGTLFCNSPDDIEALIGIGYKKAPLLELNRDELLQIHNDEKQFDRYYGGLISFFRLKDDDPDFPRKKYHFIPIEAPMSMANSKEDPYYQAGRNSGMEEKSEWIINFLTDPKRKNEKTLLYAEFMDKAITVLMNKLTDKGLNVVEITGSENIKEKQAGIKLYNTHKIQLLVFSKAIKEGISFKETNNFIFIQPYWNYAISEQIIARAVRLDSHIKKQKSLVNIYCLIGVNQNDMKVYSKDEIDKLYGSGVNLGSLDPSNKYEIINCPEHLVSKQNEYMKQFYKQQQDDKKEAEKKEEKPSLIIKKWIDEANTIMNEGIKILEYPRVKRVQLFTEKSKKGKKEILTQYFDVIEKIENRHSSFSRDTYIWDMMFNKQENINVFEKKLLQPKLSFENYITNENNEFIQEFNLELEKLKDEGKTISNKQEIELKRKLYKKQYEKKIEETNKTIQRFSGDIHFKVNRNPDLQQLAQNQYNDSEVAEKMKKLFNSNASLTKILETFKIDKQQITNFQANFTSKENVNTIIEMSKIKDDKRNKIFVLEGTSGIGGVISQLLKVCPNKDNFMVDSNEYHNVFYNFQKLLFKGLDNVFIYNTDFTIFESKYGYHYILGNPPFNLRLQQKRIVKGVEKKILNDKNEVIGYDNTGDKIIYVDKTFYDVDFVAHAYNLLQNPSEKGGKDGGVLCMIISNRFTRDERTNSFKSFREFIKNTKKYDETSFNMIETGEFDYQKENTEGTKEMTTKYPMVCIYLRKLFNIVMNLDKKVIIKDEDNLEVKEKKEDVDEELERELNELKLPASSKKSLKIPPVKYNLNEELQKDYIDALKKPKKEKKEKEPPKKEPPKPKDMRGTRVIPVIKTKTKAEEEYEELEKLVPKKELEKRRKEIEDEERIKDEEYKKSDEYTKEQLRLKKEADEYFKELQIKAHKKKWGDINKVLTKEDKEDAENISKKLKEERDAWKKNLGNGKRSPYYYETKGKGIIDNVKAFFTGRKDYPPNIRKFIEENKDLTITGMKVGRRPIKSFITTVGNALTFGGLKDAMKKYNYDDLLHLWLEFTMSNGKSHIVEKDEVIKIGAVDNREGEKTNFMDVPIKNTVNVYDFFYKPLKEVGKNLVEYSAHKYNCQNFVMNLLKYSGNLTPELEKFILQDVEKMLGDPKFSLHKTFIKFITDAGAKLDVLKQGAGKEDIQAVIFNKKNKKNHDEEYRKEFLKSLGIKPSKKVHITGKTDEDGFYRYRIKEPNEEYDYRTKKLKNGIEIIYFHQKNKMVGEGLMDFLKKHKNKILGTLGTVAGVAGVLGAKHLQLKHQSEKNHQTYLDAVDNYYNNQRNI